MLRAIEDLTTNGVALFHDEGLKYEIANDSHVDITKNDELEFYIAIKHRQEGDKRYGMILHLEEEFLSFGIDLVEMNQGIPFRNYDNIDSIETEVIFDDFGFMRNLLLGMMDKQVYHVLEFISRYHMHRNTDWFKMCACEPDRRTQVSCDTANCGRDIPVWRFNPDGWWGQNTKPPSGYYNFLTDYFMEPGGEQRESIFNQFIYNEDVVRIITNQYLDHGYTGYTNANGDSTVVCFNYINNIYPEQTAIMNYRWRYGGYDVSWLEYRINKTFVYNTMRSWYKGSRAVTTYHYIADEMTVRGHTDIAKTETRRIFERDEHILEELLGPKHCISYGDQGRCTMYGYGDFLPESSEERNLWDDAIINDKPWPPGELPEHSFVTIYNPGFESMGESYINSQAYRAIAEGYTGVSPADAFYAIEHSHGKIGGKYVFKDGTGNEHRYFMRFEDFLSEQGWSLDDFMSIYSAPISDRRRELRKSMITSSAPYRVCDFSEFYDKNHKAPFDGIYHYIPIIPTMNPDLGGSGMQHGTKVSKKKVIINQSGEETIVDLGDEPVQDGAFTLPINKDEFIYDVRTENALRVLVSDFMKIRVKISFKDRFPTLNQTNIRISTSDFTYMQLREFDYNG